MNTLSEKRLTICKKCGLYKETQFGPVCNSGKYINKEGKISFLPKEGYVKGCGCFLEKKTQHVDNHCVVGLW